VLPVIQGILGSASAGSVTGAPTHMRPTLAQPTQAGSTFRSVNTQARKPAPHVRWYQIKKNDRYISIARRQLGDARRWREVYELNKDKFPDPQRIREGVRIKLPLTTVRGTHP
jgi:nucleoid-associated protein YgaU